MPKPGVSKRKITNPKEAELSPCMHVEKNTDSKNEKSDTQNKANDSDNKELTQSVVFKIYGIDKLDVRIAASLFSFYSEVVVCLAESVSSETNYEFYITRAGEGCFEILFQFLADFIQSVSDMIGQIPPLQDPVGTFCDCLNSITNIACMNCRKEKEEEKTPADVFAEKTIKDNPEIEKSGNECKEVFDSSSQVIEGFSFSPAMSNNRIRSWRNDVPYGCVALMRHLSSLLWTAKFRDDTDVVLLIPDTLQTEWGLRRRNLPVTLTAAFTYQKQHFGKVPVYHVTGITKVSPGISFSNVFTPSRPFESDF